MVRRSHRDVENDSKKLDVEGDAIKQDIIALFEAWVIARADDQDRLTATTVKSYSTRARRIGDFFGEHKVPLASANKEILGLLMTALGEDDNRGRYLNLIDSLLVFANKRAGLDADKANRAAFSIRSSKEFGETLQRSGERNPGTLSPSARHRFIRWFQGPAQEGSWFFHRDRAICAAMLGAGLKPMEALAVRFSDLVFDTVDDAKQYRAWKIRVGGNGNNGVHETLVADYAQYCLSKWVKTASAMGLITGDDSYLFPNRARTGPLEASVFNRQFAEILKELDVVRSYTPQMLRNTWLVENLKNATESEIRFIRQCAGLTHADSILPFMNIIDVQRKQNVV